MRVYLSIPYPVEAHWLKASTSDSRNRQNAWNHGYHLPTRPFMANFWFADNSGVNGDKRVCEKSSRVACEKTRARLLQSSRFRHLCRFISEDHRSADV